MVSSSLYAASSRAANVLISWAWPSIVPSMREKPCMRVPISSERWLSGLGGLASSMISAVRATAAATSQIT